MDKATDPTECFISFEGGEGSGKSTQIKRLAKTLRIRGHTVILTREPGGSPDAEVIRHVLLSGQAETFGLHMEAILFAAARIHHIEQVIRPALHADKIVLCDRFMDSSRVYQGVTGRLEPDFMSNLERIAVDGVIPNLTFIIDIPAQIGLERAHKRSMRNNMKPDRFERESLEIHEIRRQAFHDLARNEPDRCKLIDGTKNEDAVALAVLEWVDAIIPICAKRTDGKGRE